MRTWARRAYRGLLVTDEVTHQITGSDARGRFLGSMFLLGATIASVSMALPQPPGTDVAALFGLYAIAYLIGAALLIRGAKCSEAALQVSFAAGTLLVSLGMIFTEERTGVYGMFYVWIAVVAFYFLSRAAALVQVAIVTIVYTVVLSIEPPPAAEEQWMITIGTVAVGGALVGALRARVERLVARLFAAARTDPLTEIHNRRGFQERLEAELELSLATGNPVSIAMADLDHFKVVNDRLGHQAGDAALKRVAARLLAVKRGMDIAARVGGEEFAVVLPASDKHSGYLFAERLRSAVRAEFADDPVPITISIGVASFPADAPAAEALLGAGDHALYAAKQLGRDRSVLYSSEIISGLMSREAAGRARDNGQLAAVLVLAETLDLRDAGTAAHSQIVSRYASMIGRRLSLSEEKIENLRLAGALHDIGKIGIADSVLQKAGPLDDAEWAEMREHPEIGARILRGAGLDRIAEWVLAHHERPDGRGYPFGLRADEIELEARILAVADAYEAMTSDRVYRRAIGHEAAQDELRRWAGEQFDADVVEALIDALDAQRETAGSSVDAD